MTRLKEINFIRAISIIAVGMIHIGTSNLMVTPQKALKVPLIEIYVYHQLTSFAVSAFIVVSGITLIMSYKRKPFNLLEFLYLRSCYLIIPYFIWSLFYLNLKGQLFNVHNLTGLAMSPEKYIPLFMTGSSYYHLWFMPVIIYSYLLFPLIRQIVKPMRSLLWIIFLVSLQIAIQYTASKYIHNSVIYYIKFISYIGLFTIGCYVGNNYDKVKEFINKYILLISIIFIPVLIYKTYDYFHSVYSLKADFTNLPQTITWENRIYTLLVMAIIIYVTPKIKFDFIDKMFNKLGENTFGVYFVHPFILLQVVLLTRKYHIDLGSGMIFVALIGIVIISYAISELINMVPYGYLFIGKNNRPIGAFGLKLPKLKDIITMER